MTYFYSIAEMAKEFEITTRTIRFYEDKGLVVPNRSGQRRIYTARDRVRLRLIMRGKRLGFSLDEILEIFDLYDSDPTEVSQLKHFLGKINQRKKQLERQHQDIVDTLSELSRIEAQCTDLLNEKENI